MSTEIQNKVDEVARLFNEFKDKNDKNITDTASNLNAAITRLQEQQDEIKLALVQSKAVDAVGEAKEKAEFTKKERKAFTKWMRNGQPATAFAKSAEALELKATVGNETTNADGGYGVPTVIQQAVDLIIQETSDIEPLTPAVTIGTEVYNKLLDNNDATATWGSEISTSGTGLRSQTNVNTYTRVQITPQILYANPQLSLEMMEDVQFDAEAELIKALGDRLSRSRNTGFVNGSGSGSQQPAGFLTYAGNNVTNGANAPVVGDLNTVLGGGTGAIISDDIYALIYNLRSGYRKNGTFAMHRSVQQIVRTLKDSYGRYMWEPNYQAGQPSKLAGYDVAEFDDMPQTINQSSSNTLAITFADWKNFYRIVNRVGLMMLRDPYTVEGAVVFKTRQRVSGGIENGIAGVTLSVPY